jgi:hypothetical protein
VELDQGVAVRVAALCLDGKGRLSQRFLASAAVRAGLLVDLALAGRVESTDDSILIDATPTGFDPADLLLAAIAVEPERSLDDWLDEGSIGLRQVADAAVRSGRWERIARPLPGRGRLRVRERAQTEADRQRDLSTVTDGWSAGDSAVTAIALVAGLVAGSDTSVLAEFGETLAEPVPASVLSRTEPVQWLCEAVTRRLAELRARDLLAATALRAGGSSVR